MLGFAYKNVIKKLNLTPSQIGQLQERLKPENICFGNFVQGAKICPTTTALGIVLGRSGFDTDREVKDLFKEKGVAMWRFYFFYIFFDLPSYFSKRYFRWALRRLRIAAGEIESRRRSLRKIRTKSKEETQALAREWLGSLGDQVTKSRKGAVTIVGLVGDLGSGKTSFAQGVAKALGVSEHVTSPTFVLERIYQLSGSTAKLRGWESLVHIDAYRLEGKNELKHLDWEKISADPGNLILVEWPERIFPEGLPSGMRVIRFEFVDDTTRKINL
jgi:tRNA threonylcarbamoyladenosine biosynthesis protein TsaE